MYQLLSLLFATELAIEVAHDRAAASDTAAAGEQFFADCRDWLIEEIEARMRAS